MNTASQVAILARAMDAGNGGTACATTCPTGVDGDNVGIALPSGTDGLSANCNASSCTVTISGTGDLKELIESAIGTSNGFYTATVTS